MFLLNGKPADSISLLDRGLHYGDGLFETIAVFKQQPLSWDMHLQRLLSGCAKLKINFEDVDLLKTEATALCQNVDCAVLKIIITSNSGGRGYQRPDTAVKPTRLLAMYPWPDRDSEQIINARICKAKLGHQPMLAGVKHLNRLEQVLVRNEWQDGDTENGIQEGLMLDIENNVIEGTMSNLFAIYPDKKLRTPDLSMCGIEGIVRQYLLDHSEEIGYSSEISKLSLDDIYSADEIFFCNSIAGVLPVGQLDKKIFDSQSATKEIKQFLQAREVIAPS